MRLVCSMKARASGRVAAVLALITAVVGPNLASGAGAARLDPALCAPGKNTFTLAINNPFLPFRVGQQWVYTGREEGERLGLQVTVLGATETLYRGAQRVRTRVVQNREWIDANGNGRMESGEELKEVSRNYFTQTGAGDVCHFGEQKDVYEDGRVVNHEGSWRADAGRNAPGIYMPARPRVGMSYQQQIAPGVAVDTAAVVASGVRTTVPVGTFTNTIRVRDRNPLDGSTGTKIYARGVGLVVEGPLKLVRH